MTESSDVDGLPIKQAIEMYLNYRGGEVTESTLKAHRYRLSHLVRWAEEKDIETTAEFDGRTLNQYRTWRQQDGGLNNVTLHTQLSTLRVFIRWCEQIDAVETGLHEKILLPQLGRTEDQRDAMLDSESAGKLIEYLRQFEFATRTHALVEVLWHTGMRIGAVQSLDLQDYDSEDRLLEVRHRPDQGTTLKNKEQGERYVALKESVCDVLDAYIEYKRNDVVDEYGREPLFTSTHGRPEKSTLRDSLYRITRPCIYTGNCPHDRDQETCEAMDRNRASKCPSSVSPHAIRRGSITHYLSEDAPEKAVSDRMDVSLDVLEKHYDRRTERSKSEQRRDYFD
jgi:site-specific recombinase XerD